MTIMIEYLNRVQTEVGQTESAAALFHEQSKTHPHLLRPPPARYDPDLLPQISQRAYKTYRLAKRVGLPEPQSLPVMLDELMLARRSAWAFTTQAVTKEAVATQLGLSYRVIGERFRPIPSGGALYPLELYPIALNISDLPSGLYHYNPRHHDLEHLSSTAPYPRLQNILFKETLPSNTPYLLCICGVLPRNRFKYGDLGYRLLLLEAGHLAHNIILIAQAQGLGVRPICGFYDDQMHDYLAVDGVDEVCLYLLAIGHPTK